MVGKENFTFFLIQYHQSATQSLEVLFQTKFNLKIYIQNNVCCRKSCNKYVIMLYEQTLLPPPLSEVVLVAIFI